MVSKYYTGVGSRTVPQSIYNLMKYIGYILAKENYILRSGGAFGSDSAFEKGCDDAGGKKEIYLAKHSTEGAENLAQKFHSVWNMLSPYSKKLHGRNAFQVLGKNLDTPSCFLICWTPDGCTSHKDRTIDTGGTGTAISIASHYNIPIYNLARKEHLNLFGLNLFS